MNKFLWEYVSFFHFLIVQPSSQGSPWTTIHIKLLLSVPYFNWAQMQDNEIKALNFCSISTSLGSHICKNYCKLKFMKCAVLWFQPLKREMRNENEVFPRFSKYVIFSRFLDSAVFRGYSNVSPTWSTICRQPFLAKRLFSLQNVKLRRHIEQALNG